MPFSRSDYPVMTRFYFHIHDGTHAFLDDGGPDLPGEAAALAEARQTIRGIAGR